MAAEEEWVSTAQAAEELGVVESRVRQLCLAGELPAEKYPPDRYRGSWRIRRSDLERYKARRGQHKGRENP